MGPGSRRDMLDDHFNDWNWKKVIGMSECQNSLDVATYLTKQSLAEDRLLTRIEDAILEKAKHAVIQHDFERAIPAELLDEWRAKVVAWEKDRSNLIPYEVVAKRTLSHFLSHCLSAEFPQGLLKKL